METEKQKDQWCQNTSGFRAKGFTGHSELWCGELVHPGRTGIAVSKRASRPNSVCVFVYTQHVKVQSCFSHFLKSISLYNTTCSYM